MSERDNLETHVDLCELRYNQLDQRMSKIEQQVKDLNIDVQDLKEENRKGFADLRMLIEQKQSGSHQSLIAAAGTIIVALIGFLGFLLMHIK